MKRTSLAVGSTAGAAGRAPGDVVRSVEAKIAAADGSPSCMGRVPKWSLHTLKTGAAVADASRSITSYERASGGRDGALV